MTDETTQALLPCPFCGHAEMHAMLGVGGGDRGYSMLCGGCGVRQGSAGRSQSEAITAWNTRLAHSLPSQASDAGEEMLREVLVDHFPTGLRGSYERTAGGIVVDTGMKTDCHCGWSAQASDEHEVRDLWARHVASTLTAPPTSGEEMRLVPVEPTEEMYLAAFASDHWGGVQPIRRVVDEIWSSMLRAALTKGAE